MNNMYLLDQHDSLFTKLIESFSRGTGSLMSDITFNIWEAAESFIIIAAILCIWQILSSTYVVAIDHHYYAGTLAGYELETTKLIIFSKFIPELGNSLTKKFINTRSNLFVLSRAFNRIILWPSWTCGVAVVWDVVKNFRGKKLISWTLCWEISESTSSLRYEKKICWTLNVIRAGHFITSLAV